MAEILKVRGAARPGEIILHERDDDHPDGEIFITGGAEVSVARTTAVARLLRDGRLVESGSPITPAEKARTAPTKVKAPADGLTGTTSADPTSTEVGG